MAQITEPPLAVLSGPLARRNDLKRSLEGAGLTVLDPGPLPDDPTVAVAHRGLSSYPNPDLAADAGAPNAGHTPNTEHPETGEAYEGDPRIGFLDVQVPDGGLDRICELAHANRFVLRVHYPEHVITVPDLTVEQRLAIVENQMAAIRQIQRGGTPR